MGFLTIKIKKQQNVSAYKLQYLQDNNNNGNKNEQRNHGIILYTCGGNNNVAYFKEHSLELKYKRSETTHIHTEKL